jgi:hypothetical protein
VRQVKPKADLVREEWRLISGEFMWRFLGALGVLAVQIPPNRADFPE